MSIEDEAREWGLGCSDVLEALSVHHSWWRIESMTEGLDGKELLDPMGVGSGDQS
jgi:hypothetical protein